MEAKTCERHDLADAIKSELDKATSDKLECIKENFTNVVNILKE